MNSKMLDLNEVNQFKNECTNNFGFDLKTNYIFHKSNIVEINKQKDKVSLKKG